MEDRPQVPESEAHELTSDDAARKFGFRAEGAQIIGERQEYVRKEDHYTLKLFLAGNDLLLKLYMPYAEIPYPNVKEAAFRKVRGITILETELEENDFFHLDEELQQVEDEQQADFAFKRRILQDFVLDPIAYPGVMPLFVQEVLEKIPGYKPEKFALREDFDQESIHSPDDLAEALPFERAVPEHPDLIARSDHGYHTFRLQGDTHDYGLFINRKLYGSEAKRKVQIWLKVIEDDDKLDLNGDTFYFGRYLFGQYPEGNDPENPYLTENGMFDHGFLVHEGYGHVTVALRKFIQAGYLDALYQLRRLKADLKTLSDEPDSEEAQQLRQNILDNFTFVPDFSSIEQS